MNLTQYRRIKYDRFLLESRPRSQCLRCRKPKVTCFCAQIETFAPAITFVILIHPEEARRSVATGRMTHLCLGNSKLFEGLDFTQHEDVNQILHDPHNYSVLLYPGPRAVNLTQLTEPARRELFPGGRKLVVILLDATWTKAKAMHRLSRNLHSLPQVCFTPPRLSEFHVRKQPNENCFSTIEAVHFFLELFSEPPNGVGGNLLQVFSYMVNQQVKYQNGRKRRV